MYKNKLIPSFLIILLLFASDISAQTKRSKSNKKPATTNKVENSKKPKDDPNSPPLEEYTCYQINAAAFISPYYTPSSVYSGYIILEPNKKYTWGYGKGKPDKTGSYTFDSKGVHFTKGKLADVDALFEIKDTGRHMIELHIVGEKEYESDDGITKVYCNCNKHDVD